MACFTHGKNVFTLIRARFVINSQEKQIELYKQEIDEMKLKINSLSDNRDTLERYAREQFYFCSPDEDVYIIKGDQ